MALSGDALQEYRPETVRGTAGFFRVGRNREGFWSLLDPEGREFFACAVNDVDEPAAGAVEPAEVTVGSIAPVARLRTWGFNTLGAGAASTLRERGLPWIGTVDFCAAGPAIRAGGARLPDVFDPDWPRTAREAAAVTCEPWVERTDLIGWLADDGLDWAQPAPGGATDAAKPTLLQICLSLEPGFAAYHAAWEFVLAPHAGQFARLAKAWGLALTHRETLRELTRAEQAIATRGYLRDNARWTRECAERYFAATSAAIRAHDPRHLVLGARARRPAGAAMNEIAAAAAELPWVHWTEIGAAATGPVLAGDFTWARPEFYELPAGARVPGQTAVERMLRRGRAALRRLVMQPAVVGYAWRQWRDAAGEQPPFAGGLVHANGAEAREHTELVADINGKVRILRPLSVAPYAS